MEKVKTYQVTGLTENLGQYIVFSDLDTAIDAIKMEAESLNVEDEKNFIIKVDYMTEKELKGLPEFEG